MKTAILAAALVLLLALPLAGASSVTRSFSKNTGIYPGEVISVTLSVVVNGGESYYLIDEVVPSSWIITDPGSGSIILNHIRWVVFQGAASTSYIYQVMAPGAGIYTFSGKYVFEPLPTEEPMEVVTGGETQVEVIKPLADFSTDSVHLQVGKGMIVKTYVSNPNSTFANITVWLGGDYPQGLARFSGEEGVYFTPDFRNATLGLNPKEEKTLSLVISSTDPRPGGYRITLDANTTADSLLKDRKTMSVFTDFEPSFPGLESWGIALILGLSGLAFWISGRQE